MADPTPKTSTAQKPEEVSINSSPDISRGHYANAIKLATTDSETIIDFAFVFPTSETQKQGEHVARIIVGNDFALKIAEQITKTVEEHKEKQKKQGA